MKTQLVNIFFVLFLVSGCSTIKVKNDFNPDVSFTELKSYEWMVETPKRTGDPRIDDNSLLQNRVKQAVESSLALKGYSKVNTGKPDFWVSYHATLDKRTRIDEINTYNQYSPGWGWRYGRGGSAYGGQYINERSSYTYDEGTLIVDIINPENRELIWRGSATDTVNFSHSPEEKEQKINEAVEKLLEQFPPK
mgnify:CR=1 FL=1